MEALKITLKRSLIGRCEKHKKILKALGLRKLNQSVLHNDTPSIRGMIGKVSHMIDVGNVKKTEFEKAESEHATSY